MLRSARQIVTTITCTSALVVCSGALVVQGLASPLEPVLGPNPPVTSPALSGVPQRRRYRGQRSPTAERLREIQKALVRLGFYEGEPSGKWDAKTREALRQFQEDNGLEATGKLDSHSLILLGLGPETAGVSAPRPRAAKQEETGNGPDSH